MERRFTTRGGVGVGGVGHFLERANWSVSKCRLTFDRALQIVTFIVPRVYENCQCKREGVVILPSLAR